jgi:hypothetical protein
MNGVFVANLDRNIPGSIALAASAIGLRPPTLR